MSTLSTIRNKTCFEAILKCQSWLPGTGESSVPDKIRTIALEKLLTCQETLLKTLHDITAVPIATCETHDLIRHVKELKLFNDNTNIVSNFLKSPMGELLLPKQSELNSKVKERLEKNYQAIDKHLSLALEKLSCNRHDLSSEDVFAPEFLENLFEKGYSCYSFAPFYVNLLLKNSELHINEWLKNEPHLLRRLSSFPCHILLKIFNGFQHNLNNESYPLGFITRNIHLIDYYTEYLAVTDPETKALLAEIDDALIYTFFPVLTRINTHLLRKILTYCRDNNRKQLIRFLHTHSDEHSLALNFKKFRTIIRRFPLIKSKQWMRTIAFYRRHKKLFTQLFNQRCLQSKASRLDLCIQIGLSDPNYLRKLVQLTQGARGEKRSLFYYLVKRLSYNQLMHLKPLVEWNPDSSSSPLILQGLQFFTHNPEALLPLMRIPENKRSLWLILFAKLREGTVEEVETVFEDHSELKLFMTLFHPYKVKPFISDIQTLIQSRPDLEKPFASWLSNVMNFLKNKKNKHLDYQNRSIALRALEMQPQHIVPFFDYASTRFYYRHLSHLLYLEKECPNEFLLVLDFAKQNPEFLYRLSHLCHRLGKTIVSDLLKAWKDYPELVLKIMENHDLSLIFFEGFLLYLRTHIKRVISSIDLNERHPGIFQRLNQDIHLLSTSLLNHLVSDRVASSHFHTLILNAMPHHSGTLAQSFSEAFEMNSCHSIRVLAASCKTPLTFLYLIHLVKQKDSEALIYLECLEKQPASVAYKIAYLMEVYEHRELAKALCKLLETQSNRKYVLKFLDLAFEGYVKEATELANRYLCCQFSSLNSFLFFAANSQNGHLIKTVLDADEMTKREIIAQLESNREDQLFLIQSLCRKHYLLSEFLRNFLHSGQPHRVLDEVKKGNWLTAEWLIVNQVDTTKHEANLIIPLLENINKKNFYNAKEKPAALEVALSIGIALSLMSPKGVIQRSQIPTIKQTILSQVYIPVKTDAIEHVLHVLSLLESDGEDICIKFQLYERPFKPLKTPLQQILNNFIDDIEFDDLRYCVLSALFVRPRQNNYLGNCFASQLLIQSSSTARGLSLAVDDYFEILTYGSLKRLDPVKKEWVEYKLPESIHYLPNFHLTEHPLHYARENLLTQMGSEVHSQRLHRQNMDLLRPQTRHNYLFRTLEKAPINNSKSLFHTAKCLQQSFKDLSEIIYEAYAIEPQTKTPGAWRLVQKEPKKLITSFEEYVEFLHHVIDHSITGVDADGIKMLEHLRQYLSNSNHFHEKLHSYYKKKKQSFSGAHWLDYSGGVSEAVRLRYYNHDFSRSLNRHFYILGAEDALRGVFSFRDLLSNRICSKINSDKDFRIPFDYPNHCANLLLFNIRNMTVETVIDTMMTEVSNVRNVILIKTSYHFLIDHFRGNITSTEADYWGHLIYKKIQEPMSIGQFCDACVEALRQVCIPQKKQAAILAIWEDRLRAFVPRTIPNVLKLIDTNWKDHPFNNVYLGIGGSIFYQKLIFFRSHKETYLAEEIDFAAGQWDFTLPIDL